MVDFIVPKRSSLPPSSACVAAKCESGAGGGCRGGSVFELVEVDPSKGHGDVESVKAREQQSLLVVCHRWLQTNITQNHSSFLMRPRASGWVVRGFLIGAGGEDTVRTAFHEDLRNNALAGARGGVAGSDGGGAIRSKR